MAQQVSFRVSEWGRNNKGNNEAIFHSRIYEGISYRFSTERERNRYFCANCYSKDKIKVRLVIRDDVFSRNPDELPHVCRQIKEATIYAVKNRKVVNEQKRIAETSPAIPSHTYQKVSRRCEAEFDNAQQRHNTLLALPDQKSLARTFRRANAKGKTQVVNVRAIPADLKSYDKPYPVDLIRLRQTAAKENFFVIYEELRPNRDPLIIFGDMMGLWTLHESEHVSCDGTFKFVPHQPHVFAQVYTIHAVHQMLPDRSQATLSAFALMSSKDGPAYSKVFDELSTQLFVLFGSSGARKIWHFDHEIGAINACKLLFPNDSIVSCYFHFSKNCLSHAADLGLKRRLQKDKSLRKWFKTLVGGVHLITDHQKALWDYLLLNAPQIAEYAALASFIQYFQRQWNVETARELLNQYNNDGPRTTNFSEGWNFTLRNQFGAKHPALGEFIQSMQKELYAHSVQSERLFRGQPIRLRKQKYRKAEKQLAEIRLEYVAAMEHLGEEITQDDIQAVLIPFARKMAYCCATFVDAEMLLENSALEEEEPAAGEENEQNSELSSFFAVIDD